MECGFLARLNQQWHCLPVVSRLISGKSNPSHFVVDTQGNAQPLGIVDAALAAVFFVKECVKSKPLCVVADAFFSKANFINPLIERGITLMQLGVNAVRVKGAVAVGAISQSRRQRMYSLNRRAKDGAQPFNPLILGIGENCVISCKRLPSN